jgi:hypothetical protein
MGRRTRSQQQNSSRRGAAPPSALGRAADADGGPATAPVGRHATHPDSARPTAHPRPPSPGGRRVLATLCHFWTRRTRRAPPASSLSSARERASRGRQELQEQLPRRRREGRLCALLPAPPPYPPLRFGHREALDLTSRSRPCGRRIEHCAPRDSAARTVKRSDLDSPFSPPTSPLNPFLARARTRTRQEPNNRRTAATPQNTREQQQP